MLRSHHNLICERDHKEIEVSDVKLVLPTKSVIWTFDSYSSLFVKRNETNLPRRFLRYSHHPYQVNLNQLIGQGIHKEVISKSKALDGLGHLYLMAIRLFLFAYAPPGLIPNRLPSMLL